MVAAGLEKLRQSAHLHIGTVFGEIPGYDKVIRARFADGVEHRSYARASRSRIMQIRQMGQTNHAQTPGDGLMINWRKDTS